MHFFLFDFALAFVALLGYRAVAAVTQDHVAAVSFEGGRRPRPAADFRVARAGKRHESGPSGAMGCCGERAPHRLINFW